MRRNVRRLNREVGNVISISAHSDKYESEEGEMKSLEKEPGTSTKKVPKSRKAANLAGIESQCKKSYRDY